MAVLLGGRAAELIVFGHLSTGAADDLRRVTDIARSMVTRYGMSEKLGSVAYERDTALLPHRPRSALAAARARLTARTPATRSTTEVRAIVQTAPWTARSRILRERRDVLERTARRLLEKETLDEAELMSLVGPSGTPLPQAAE